MSDSASLMRADRGGLAALSRAVRATRRTYPPSARL
jgi:hypothetical protein